VYFLFLLFHGRIIITQNSQAVKKGAAHAKKSYEIQGGDPEVAVMVE